MSTVWPSLTLVLLGAYHGANPAMGWLFAVALGLQERSRRAVLRAFWPIALGHAASVAAVIAAVTLARGVVAPPALRLGCAIALLTFGVVKLAVNAHPRWVGMRVGFRDLTAWSFLMSTAHGAGLMLVPLLLRLQDAQGAMTYLCGISVPSGPAADLAATAIHSAVMLLVMAAVALAVYEKLGVAILRRAWLNLDRIWAGALVGAGLITLAGMA